jgi:hypothetical protein
MNDFLWFLLIWGRNIVFLAIFIAVCFGICYGFLCFPLQGLIAITLVALGLIAFFEVYGGV